jgi:hypothetical protein
MQIPITADPDCGLDPRECIFAADALDRQAAEFCAVHGLPPVAVTYYSTDVLLKLDGEALSAFTRDSWLLTIQKTLDVPDALGFHNDVANTVFARVEYQGAATWETAGHEILEMILDPTCDKWSDLGNGKEQATEACDRVQGNTYVVTGRIGNDSMDFNLPNYLLPSAFIPNSASPWDKLGVLTAWNALSPEGYMIVRNPDGSEVDVFADTIKGESNADAKRKKVGGRAYRRLR